jgi:hypothetical protein
MNGGTAMAAVGMANCMTANTREVLGSVRSLESGLDGVQSSIDHIADPTEVGNGPKPDVSRRGIESAVAPGTTLWLHEIVVLLVPISRVPVHPPQRTGRPERRGYRSAAVEPVGVEPQLKDA